MEALNIILDAAIALIIIFFAVRGARRGFVLTLAGLVTYIIAIVGSMLVVHLFAGKVAADFIAPMVQDKLLPAIGEAGDVLGLEDMVIFGVRIGDLPSFGEMDAAITNGVSAFTEPIVDALSVSIARCLISIVSFVVILLVLKVVAHALDFVARLPVLGTLNGLLGCVMGLVTGVLLVLLAVSVLSLFTGLIPPEVAEKTILFGFFQKLSPFSFISRGGAAL